MSSATKKICVYALGMALYVALSLCVQAPVFENYYLCLGYVVMAVYCFSFGPAAGAAVGGMGVVLYCLLTSGLRGMPGWALGNVAVGVMLGYVFRWTKPWEKAWLRGAVNTAAIVLATAAGMLVIKSGVECALYGQPFLFRTAKNVYAFIADAVVLLAGLPVCRQMDGYLRRHWKGVAA